MLKKFNIDSSHNIYIVKAETKTKALIKIGYSENIDKRLSSYYHHNPLTNLIGSFYVKEGLLFEKEFHNSNVSVIMNEWYEEEYLEKFKLYFTVHNPFYYEDGVYYDLSDTNSHLSLNTNLYYYLKDKSYRIEYNENDIIHSIFCKDGFKVVLFKINNKHYLNLINNESTTTEIESLKYYCFKDSITNNNIYIYYFSLPFTNYKFLLIDKRDVKLSISNLFGNADVLLNSYLNNKNIHLLN
jgi:hypothetical protein